MNDAEYDPEEDTELEEPIKIRWTGDARSKFLTRRLTPSIEDGELPDRIKEVCTRQKTNLVIETEWEKETIIEELEAFINYQCHPRGGLIWATRGKQQAAKRVLNELTEEDE